MLHPDEPLEARPGVADDRLLEALTGIVLEAGRAVLGLRGRDGHRGRGVRAPAAPVADAGRLAHEVILEGLAEIAPGTPVIGESGPAAGVRGGAYFLVDPIDGAVEHGRNGDGSGEFTINIGLVSGGAPIAGVVYAPALERLWGARPGAAWRASAPARTGVGPSCAIRVRPAPEQGVTAVASRSNRSPELEALLRAYRVAEFRAAGSSLKFCLLAEGSADLYPELGRSMAWSTAAGDAILRAAGGRTVTLDGAPLTYSPRRSAHDEALANPQFVALGSIGLRPPAPA